MVFASPVIGSSASFRLRSRFVRVARAGETKLRGWAQDDRYLCRWVSQERVSRFCGCGFLVRFSFYVYGF